MTEVLEKGIDPLEDPEEYICLAIELLPQEEPEAVEHGAPEENPSDDTYLRLSQDLDHGFRRLLEAFEAKLAYDAHKERQIDLLHDQLQEHRRGLLSQAMRPILAGLIRLHDDLGRLAKEIRQGDGAELKPERVAKLFTEFQEDVEIILEENGILAFQEPGERFEPRRQAASKVVPTDHAEDSERIARRLRPGFERDGYLLQKERVEVYSLQRNISTSSESPS